MDSGSANSTERLKCVKDYPPSQQDTAKEDSKAEPDEIPSREDNGTSNHSSPPMHVTIPESYEAFASLVKDCSSTGLINAIQVIRAENAKDLIQGSKRKLQVGRPRLSGFISRMVW